MKELETPPAIVVKAEAIEGVGRLAAEISKHYQEQRVLMDKSDAHGLEIGRLICEFAESREVKAKLAIIKQQNTKGGRPKEAHCFVAEMIVSQGKSAVTERHLERCARAFLRAKKKGLPINTPIRVVEASEVIKKFAERSLDDCQPSPERLLEPLPDSHADAKEAFDPDREAARLARTIRSFFYTDEGHPRLRTKAQRDAFARKLQEQFEQEKIEWEIVPKGTN